MSYKEDLAMVKQNGMDIQYVKYQTLEICLSAVQQNGYALQFIKDQTPTICLSAVKKDGWALNFVKEQTPAICLAAVQQSGTALQFVKEQVPELCLVAIKKDIWALQYVKDLHSIADKIDQSSLDKILSTPSDILTEEGIKNAKIIIRIREANKIAELVNEVASNSFNPVNKKARL